MTAVLTKAAMDVGLIAVNGEAMVTFYRDVLGFETEQEVVRADGQGTQYRLKCGQSVLKLTVLNEPPSARAPGAGPQGATGFRYITIFISNLEELVEKCRAAGYTVSREIGFSPIFPDKRIAFVDDPDGNAVEFFEPGD